MRLRDLMVVVLCVGGSAWAGERLRFFSENKSHALEVRWQDGESASLIGFRCAAPGDIVWSNSFPFPATDRYTLEASLSNDGLIAIVEPGNSFNGPALVYFRDGKMVRQYAGGYIAAKISDEANTYEKEFLTRLHIAGGIRMFDESASLFSVWVGATDKWFALDLNTAEIAKASAQQERVWNQRAREACLKVLNGSAVPGTTFLTGTRGFYRRTWSSDDLQEDLADYYPNTLENILKFLTRRHVAGDDAWLRGLLTVPLSGGGYSGRPHGVGGPIYTGVTTLSLSGGSHARQLGDMLLAYWEGPGEIEISNHYPEGGAYQYLGEVKGEIVLPRAPKTNDGTLRITLHPIAGKATNEAPIHLWWELKSAIEMMRYKYPGMADVPDEPISHRINVRLEELSPGTYRVDALWARGRSKIRIEDVPLAGDYFETNQILTIAPGDKLTMEINCTNRLSGHQALYAADLKGWTNSPTQSVHKPKETWREALQNGGRKAELLTNLAVGPFQVKKLTYGRWHQYKKCDHPTEEDSIVVWFEGKMNSEAFLSRYEVLARSGITFGEAQSGGSCSDGTREITWITISNWPRFERTFGLRARSRDGKELGEIELPNLGQKMLSALKADKLPARTNIGRVTVEFRGLTWDGVYRPQIELRRGSERAGDWEEGTVTFEDAGGNRSHALEDLAHEKVLRCAIELFRTQQATFSDEEQWVVPLTIPAPGEFTVLADARTLRGLEIRLVAVGGTGEVTYESGGPISATDAIDPTAEPYDNAICRLFGKPPRPDVFIRGTGRDWAESLAFNTQKDRFSVVGIKPHLAIEISGATREHRIFVGAETLYGENLLHASSGRSEQNRESLHFLPLGSKPGPTTLRIVAQRCEEVAFVTEVPASARWRKKFEQVKIPFLSH